MTKEEKELLFKELSARHPYNVKLQVKLNYGDNNHKEGTYDADIEAITSYNIEVTYYDTNMHGMEREWTFMYEEVKPYLRPMSSMTDEEKKDILQSLNIHGDIDNEGNLLLGVECDIITLKVCKKYLGELNKRMFDVCHMIEKGLAIKAPEGMYNLKNK